MIATRFRSAVGTAAHARRIVESGGPSKADDGVWGMTDSRSERASPQRRAGLAPIVEPRSGGSLGVLAFRVLADEIKEILRELASQTSASEIEILCADPNEGAVADSDEKLVRALGSERVLVLSLPAELRTEDTDEELERSVRALRSAGRRWGKMALPPTSWPESAEAPSRGLVLSRIESYLQAMATTSRARNALVTVDGEVVATSTDSSELEAERIAFTLKRVAADAVEREGTSFGEIAGDDFYARSFWVGSALILFFEGPWALDFVRHRARHVCRELGHLLGELEPPPPAPASIAPVPE